jgi:hypothetical protein
MKVYPYHTVLMEDESNLNVYHDLDDCPDGRRIQPQHKWQGSANLRKCDECVRLG